MSRASEALKRFVLGFIWTSGLDRRVLRQDLLPLRWKIKGSQGGSITLHTPLFDVLTGDRQFVSSSIHRCIKWVKS